MKIDREDKEYAVCMLRYEYGWQTHCVCGGRFEFLPIWQCGARHGVKCVKH